MKDIVVIGSMALDTIETPDKTKEEVLGGSATYFSVSASFFTKVNLVATVGRDFPEKHIALLNSFGVNTSGLEIKDGLTFRWSGSYREDMNCAKTIKTQLNVFQDFKPNIPIEYSKSKYIFLANIDPDLQLYLLERSKKDTIVGCDSMNYWIQHKRPSLKKLMKKVDIMFLNDLESKHFSGESNILKAGLYMLSLGPKYVIIKRGEYGAMLFADKAVLLNIPAFLLDNVVDPTGAGDTFAGGFMGYIASKDKLNNLLAKNALMNGAIMASYTVEDFSIDRFLKLKKKDIKNRYNKFKNLITI